MTVRAATVAILLILLAAPLPAPAGAKKRPEGAAVEGRVVVRDGGAAAGARVTLRPPGADAPVAETTSDDDGRFRLETPEAGAFVLRVDGEGYAPFETDLELSPGQIQEVEVTVLTGEAERRNRAVRRYNAAAQAHAAGEWEEAVEGFREALELDPELTEAYLGLADAQLQQDEDRAALEAVERLLELAPHHPQGRRLAFTLYVRTGRDEEARRLLEEIDDAALGKAWAAELHNAGVRAAAAGELERASERFRRAAELDPDLVESRAALATVRLRAGDAGGALEAADAALALDPADSRALRARYLALDALGEEAPAVVALRAYREVAPAEADELLYERAEDDFEQGNRARAKAALQRLLELRPGFARAHYTLGLIWASEDPARAREHLRAFLATFPEGEDAATARELLESL